MFCDVNALTHKQTSNMASAELQVSTSQLKVKKRGGQFCVAGGPNGIRCTNSTYSHGISMHTFPTYQATNRLWTKFVRIHRSDFRPSKKSSLCSEHFESSCFVNRYGNFKKQLERGSVPTIFTKPPCSEESKTKPLSGRERRQVSKAYINVLYVNSG